MHDAYAELLCTCHPPLSVLIPQYVCVCVLGVSPSLQQVCLVARDTLFNDTIKSKGPRLVSDTSIYREVSSQDSPAPPMRECFIQCVLQGLQCWCMHACGVLCCHMLIKPNLLWPGCCHTSSATTVEHDVRTQLVLSDVLHSSPLKLALNFAALNLCMGCHTRCSRPRCKWL